MVRLCLSHFPFVPASLSHSPSPSSLLPPFPRRSHHRRRPIRSSLHLLRSRTHSTKTNPVVVVESQPRSHRRQNRPSSSRERLAVDHSCWKVEGWTTGVLRLCTGVKEEVRELNELERGKSVERESISDLSLFSFRRCRLRVRYLYRGRLHEVSLAFTSSLFLVLNEKADLPFASRSVLCR